MTEFEAGELQAVATGELGGDRHVAYGLLDAPTLAADTSMRTGEQEAEV